MENTAGKKTLFKNSRVFNEEVLGKPASGTEEKGKGWKRRGGGEELRVVRRAALPIEKDNLSGKIKVLDSFPRVADKGRLLRSERTILSRSRTLRGTDNCPGRVNRREKQICRRERKVRASIYPGSLDLTYPEDFPVPIMRNEKHYSYLRDVSLTEHNLPSMFAWLPVSRLDDSNGNIPFTGSRNDSRPESPGREKQYT